MYIPHLWGKPPARCRATKFSSLETLQERDTYQTSCCVRVILVCYSRRIILAFWTWVDTNRDGFDIELLQKMSASVIAPSTLPGMTIVFKASYGLGYFQGYGKCNHLRLFCQRIRPWGVGLYLARDEPPKHRSRVCNRRIKLERNPAAVSKHSHHQPYLQRCRGLALETVDGGKLEDIVISNITMRDIVNAPIFCG